MSTTITSGFSLQSFRDEGAPVDNTPDDCIVLLQQQPQAIGKDDVIVCNQDLWPGFHSSVSFSSFVDR